MRRRRRHTHDESLPVLAARIEKALQRELGPGHIGEIRRHKDGIVTERYLPHGTSESPTLEIRNVAIWSLPGLEPG